MARWIVVASLVLGLLQAPSFAEEGGVPVDLSSTDMQLPSAPRIQRTVAEESPNPEAESTVTPATSETPAAPETPVATESPAAPETPAPAETVTASETPAATETPVEVLPTPTAQTDTTTPAEPLPEAPEERRGIPPEFYTHAAVLTGLILTDVDTFNASDGFLGDGLGDALFKLGDGAVDLLLLQGLRMFGGKEGRVAGSTGIRAVLNAGINVQILKSLFGRAFPNIPNVNQQAEFTGPRLLPGHDAFPSGHTATAFAVATALSHHYPKKKWIFYSVAALVGASTVSIRTHWWGDVYAGALLGIASGNQAIRRTPNFLMIRW